MSANSNVITAAGAQLAISATLPAAHTIDAFAALSYTDVAEVVDLGEAGKEFNIVDYSPLGEREVQRRKGSYSQGERSFSVGRDITDAGQQLLSAANNSDNYYAMRITYQNGDIDYFQAMVNGYSTAIGTIDNIIFANGTLVLCLDTLNVLSTGALTSSINTAGTYTGGVAGDYTVGQASTSGAGTGVEFVVTTDGTTVTAVYISKTGSGYAAGDTVTIDAPTGHTETVAAVIDVDSVA
jgi:hypothetical protein